MLFAGVTDAIGHTPLVRLRHPARPDVEVYAKLELQNLFGMKDRVARNIVLSAKQTGALADGAPIIESSSGTMALGVALVGRSLGHAVHIVTDPRVDAVTLAKLRSLGCEVHIVEAMTSHGWQSARLERLEQLMADLPGAFWPQQYSNPDNPGAYRTLAAELLADLGRVDVLVGSVGSGGSLCGTARALRETLPGLRVIGVDCVGSALFGQPDHPERLQSGLGNSLLPANLDRRLVDEVHWLNDREAFAATRALAREQQIFAGNTSGSVYRVLGEAAARAEPGTRVVGIFPDRGDRYAGTVYDDEHWAEHGLDAMAEADRPSEVAYGTVVRSWSHASNDAGRGIRQHLLFVESNTTGTGMTALRTAASLGLVPVLLTAGPERYAGLAETGCEIVLCDTGSPVGLRAAIQARFRRDEIAGVTSTSDFYAPAVADLAAWLGLPGNPVPAMTTCRNKALLRGRLAAEGIRQPRFAVLPLAADKDDVLEAVDTIGLPCVVKPADDSGSRNVLLCADLPAVLDHVETIRAVTVNDRGLPTARVVLVEEFLQGPEFSVETFTLDGRHHAVGVTAKTTGGHPWFVELGHEFPAPIAPAVAESLERIVHRTLDATGVRFGATHTEVKLTPAGPAVIELNPRLAGGMIPELIRLSSGVDLLEQQIRAAASLPTDLTTQHPAVHTAIRFLTAPRTGTLRAVSNGAEAVGDVTTVRITARPGQTVRPPQDAYDRLGYVIARGENPAAVRAVLDEAVGRIDVEVEAE